MKPATLGAMGELFGLLEPIWKAAKWVWARTLGRKRRWYKALSALATNVQIDHFIGLLGPSKFRTSGHEYDEHVFVHPYFYVQAVTERGGRVCMYAVTTRSAKFNPPIWGGTVQWSDTLTSEGFRLGRFAFADLPMASSPTGIMGWLGARRFHYAESYYFGNPGLYQTYLLGVNDAGPVGEEVASLSSIFPTERALGALAPGHAGVPDADMEGFMQREAATEFRLAANPNTYGVVGPHIFDPVGKGMLRWLGPDLDQVRTLSPR